MENCCPISDVTCIGGPNFFVYKTGNEFVTQVKTPMAKMATFPYQLKKNTDEHGKPGRLRVYPGIYSNFCYIQIY
jgi:hypothetical protein